MRNGRRTTRVPDSERRSAVARDRQYAGINRNKLDRTDRLLLEDAEQRVREAQQKAEELRDKAHRIVDEAITEWEKTLDFIVENYGEDR